MSDQIDENLDDRRDPRSWSCDEALGVLDGLIEVLERAARFAKSGNTLAGIGEAWDALENIQDRLPDVNVGVEIGLQEGDATFEEGRYCGIRVNEYGIRLDVSYMRYSSDVGSDHESTDVAHISTDGEVSGDPDRWFRQIEELWLADELRVYAMRDHL